jgi:hypothetical protein
MQIAKTINGHGLSFSAPKATFGLGKRGLIFFMLVAVAALAMFAGTDVFATVVNDELKPLADKAIGWSTNIAIIGCVLGLSFGFAKAATTNRWEPALMPIGLGVLWGVAFGLVTLALGAPILI